MVYNPDNQYRCAIIRGKAKNELDDLLPAYALAITESCPAEEETFRTKFNTILGPHLSSPTAKTLDNHRTEIAGKLFGMWWKDETGVIHPSERTERLLRDGDNTAFFRDIVSKLQFPNGMDKLFTIKERLEKGIHIMPCAFVLKFLFEAEKKNITPTKDEVAYYILNNLDVLKGNAEVDDVLNTVIERRKQHVYKKVETPGKASSYSTQHIRELLNLMELANLIKILRDRRGGIYVKLRNEERGGAEIISKNWNKPLPFDMYRYNLDTVEAVKKMQTDWGIYFSLTSLTEDALLSRQSVSDIKKVMDNIRKIQDVAPEILNALETGDEGELYVFQHEKVRVGTFNVRLAKEKVLFLGKRKGLGYDIQSIFAESPSPEAPMYIEVKTTRRVTVPGPKLEDHVNLTRNEWVAAESHRTSYFIYRVYITNEGRRVFIIRDPVGLKEENKLFAQPLEYLVEFGETAGTLVNWDGKA